MDPIDCGVSVDEMVRSDEMALTSTLPVVCSFEGSQIAIHHPDPVEREHLFGFRIKQQGRSQRHERGSGACGRLTSSYDLSSRSITTGSDDICFAS